MSRDVVSPEREFLSITQAPSCPTIALTLILTGTMTRILYPTIVRKLTNNVPVARYHFPRELRKEIKIYAGSSLAYCQDVAVRWQRICQGAGGGQDSKGSPLQIELQNWDWRLICKQRFKEMKFGIQYVRFGSML